MTEFFVLDRQEVIHRHALLEASAGTGKTYTIEHLCVRFLLEGENPIPVQEMLIVTFTRAATQELRLRVRSAIQGALTILEGWISLGSWVDSTPDYLRVYEQKSREDIAQARYRLQAALINFGAAQIFTIHGFCHRMLTEEGQQVSEDEGVAPLAQSRLREVVRDFFRTELTERCVTSGQMRIVMPMEKLERELISLIAKPLTIRAGFLLSDIQAEIDRLLRAPEMPCKDGLAKIAAQFCGLSDRQGNLKSEMCKAIDKLSSLVGRGGGLDDLLPEAGELLLKLDPENRQKKIKEPISIPVPVGQLRDLVALALDRTRIVATLASRCQALLRRRRDQEGWQSPDDLLELMGKLTQDPEFCKRVAARYRVAIVDEFQDTDPLQWGIFDRLFLENSSRSWLYLVGDPKQSIYAFRQADIYTYLEASARLGPKARATLDTNYRSQPRLIEALNGWFSAPAAAGWMSLPRTNSALPYRSVNSPPSLEPWDPGDGRGALHFFVAEGNAGRASNWPTPHMEEEFLLPFVVREIATLRASKQVQYGQCAVLVRDRFQASRLEAAFRAAGIPANVRRARSLLEGPGYQSLLELVRAVMHPRSSSDLRVALGGPLLGWSQEKVRGLADSTTLEATLARFYEWRRLLYESGFWAMYRAVMNDIRTELLGRAGGGDLVDVLEQLAELIIEEQSVSRCTPEGLLAFLEQLPDLAADEAERFALRRDPSDDAVHILTIHVSKGLEFEVVFALGLSQRTPRRDLMVPRGRDLVPCKDGDPELESHFCEVDAEKMRQLYVAMTRAKWRVYVPLAIQLDRKEALPVGVASPIEIFMDKAGLKSQDLSTVLPCTTMSLVEAGLQIHGIGTRDFLRAELRRPPNREVIVAQRRILSFTSLSGSVDPTRHEIPEQGLPAGSETGIVLHGLMEKIAREGIRNWMVRGDQMAWISEGVQDTILEGWEMACLEMVRHALTVPLAPLPCALVDVARYMPEVEFLFRRADGDLVKGFIDLVFEWDGLLYLIDWKSNWLPDYSVESLGECIRQNDYALQARLYSEALRRLQPLGGAFYIFLRALPLEGLYYFSPGDLS